MSTTIRDAVRSSSSATARWRRSPAAVMLVTLLAAALSAHAAAAQDVDPRSTARTRIGPLYVTPRFELRDLGIDSNPFNSVEGSDADFTFTAVPEIDLAAGFRRLLVTGRSRTELTYFAKHDTERSVNQDLGATARLSARRVALSMEASYLNTRRRASDEIDARSRRKDRAADVGVVVALSPKLGAEGHVRVARMTFDPNAVFDDTRLAETLNRDTRTLTGALSYAVTPLTALGVSASATRTRFLFAPLRDSESWRAAAGATFTPRALVSGVAEVGYQRFTPQLTALPAFSGPVGFVDLSYRVVQTMRLGLRVNRAITYSYAEQEPYYEVNEVGASIRRELVPGWELEVSARRAWHRYQRIGGNPSAEMGGGRVDRLLNGGVRIGYRVGPDTRLDVEASYWERRSNQRDFLNFDGVRVGTSVVYGL